MLIVNQGNRQFVEFAVESLSRIGLFVLVPEELDMDAFYSRILGEEKFVIQLTAMMPLLVALWAGRIATND